MRLSNKEIQAICDAIEQYIISSAELRLFGSRIDDTAKGGDIDLLVVSKDYHSQAKMLFNKAEILGQIKTKIGDQKIDLVMATQEQIKNSAFLQSIYPQSVLLKTFTDCAN